MSLQDPIADLLNRIRNGQAARHETTRVPASKVKEQILKILEQEGYIQGFQRVLDGKFQALVIQLKYDEDGEPVIRGIKRISRPGLKLYSSSRAIPRVMSGLGHTVLSTSQGVMTGQRAKKLGIGGELLCQIW